MEKINKDVQRLIDTFDIDSETIKQRMELENNYEGTPPSGQQKRRERRKQKRKN